MRTRWLAAWLVGVLVGAVAQTSGAVPTQADRTRPPSLDVLFAAYEAGDYDILSRQLKTRADFTIGPKALDAFVKSWGHDWQPIRATFLLELAIAAANTHVDDAVGAILSQGATYVVQRPTKFGEDHREDAYETTWHKAAITLLVRWPDQQSLYVRALDKRYGRGRNPLQHWSELQTALTQAVRCCSQGALKNLSTFGPGGIGGGSAHAGQDASGGSLTTQTGRDPVEVPTKEQLETAIETFDRLRQYPDLRLNASVHGALLLVAVGRGSVAREWLDAAHDMGDDAQVTFAAAFARGRVLDALGHYAEAVTAYRNSLAAYPNAKSASVALSIDLARLGRREEAGRVAEAATRDSDAVDPWRGFDTVSFTTFVAELRKANR